VSCPKTSTESLAESSKCLTLREMEGIYRLDPVP
jgi:hypothetical protein